jgi:hypothetical protein
MCLLTLQRCIGHMEGMGDDSDGVGRAGGEGMGTHRFVRENTSRRGEVRGIWVRTGI